MHLTKKVYELYSYALNYPDEKVREKITELHICLDKNYPDASGMMNEFFEFAKATSIWKWEEIYTRTFDVQAISTLDVGYILFGDDYKRGELLANLNREHIKFENNSSTELADHLPNLLLLLSKHDDDDFKNDLVGLIIKPALKKIINEFETVNIEKKNKVYQKHHKTIIQQEKKYGTVYQSILKSLLMILDINYKDDNKNILNKKSFNSEFAKEMELPE